MLVYSASKIRLDVQLITCYALAIIICKDLALPNQTDLINLVMKLKHLILRLFIFHFLSSFTFSFFVSHFLFLIFCFSFFVSHFLFFYFLVFIFWFSFFFFHFLFFFFIFVLPPPPYVKSVCPTTLMCKNVCPPCVLKILGPAPPVCKKCLSPGGQTKV